MIRIARVAALLVLLAATAYALHRWTLLPLRCSRAATRGAAALASSRDDATRLRTAIAENSRALTLDRRPEIYFALGMSHLHALDRPAALEDLTRACAFDPARLAHIPYEDVRREVEGRLRGAR